jgi:hypothetical protein
MAALCGLPRSIVVVLSSISLATVAGAQTVSPEYSYDYFGQPMALSLDPGRIAVFSDGLDAAGMSAQLEAEGLRGAEAWTVPGWAMVPVPAADRHDAGIQRRVLNLAGSNTFEFVSPVFLDARGELVLMQPEILARFDSAADAGTLASTLPLSATLLETDAFSLPGLCRIHSGTRNGFETLALANDLATQEKVLYAEPDMILTAVHGYIPNDPFFSLQWGLHNTGQSGGTVDMDMDAPEAWDTTIGDVNVLVGVLDDGVQQNHPDLHLATGVTFTGTSSNGNPGNSCDNHGTSVAGTISETIDNSLGGVGVAPGCRVVGLKFTIATVPCNGSGSFAISWLTSALDYCEQNGIRVTNNSNGLGVSATITSKYDSTHANGVVHFSSTGNGGFGSIGYPASLASVNGIGALTRNGTRASFSQFGPGIGFSAPGQTIATTDRTGTAGYVSGDYVYVDGTSYSSPYASGVAALVLSVDGSLSADDVDTILNNSCVDLGAPGYDTTFGWGFINAHQAVMNAGTTPLTITGLSPSSTVDVLVPGSEQFLSIQGTGFAGAIALTYAGALVDPGSFSVVSESLITVDLPQADIGNHTLWVENASESDNTTVSVVASTAIQHQAGNGDDCNPISVAAGAPPLRFLISGPVGSTTYTYWSLSNIPSVHPVVTLCMGNNFTQLNLLNNFVIPATGYVEHLVPIAGAPAGIKIYTQGFAVDLGTPWPVSGCQSVLLSP